MTDELIKEEELREEHDHDDCDCGCHDHDHHDHEHHHHHHDDDCGCGHDHEHEHHHHEECCHGHHHHHHDDDCDCGNEGHEHHHHHHHDDDCDCGCHDHDHEHHHHHHDHSNIEVSTHEDAVIATVKMSLGTDKDAAKVQLKSFMTAVGAEAEAAGGMVGHIKFFFKESAGEMYSMTDPEDEIQIKQSALPEYSAEGVCIIVGIEPEELEDIVKLHYPGAV